MRKYLSLKSIYKAGTNFYLNPNYEYNFHSTNDRGKDFLSIRKSGSNPFFSPSTMRSNIKNQFDTSQIRSNNSLYSFKEICSYPYMKKRQNSDSGYFYRNLYLKFKPELDLEKKRNERMKYDKKVHENNTKNSRKEKDIYLKIKQLKNKQKEIPIIKETYEQMINKLKEDANKKIDYLNNQLNSLSKENMELNYRLKKNDNIMQPSMDDLIKKLNNENNKLKIELENRDQIIEQIKSDNDELNNLVEKLANKFHQEYTNLKYQNSKLNQTKRLNLNEIKKLTDELSKLRKGNPLGNQTMFNLKNGNENKNNEISSLKKLLSQKDEGIDELNKEIKRNSDLLGKNDQSKKENEQNKVMIIKNTEISNLLKQKLPKMEDDYKKLSEENEQFKQKNINLKIIENKYKDLLEESESFKKKNNKLKEENNKPKEDNKNINDLKNKYDSLNIDYKSILNEKNNLEKECNEMKKNIKNLQQEINSLKDKISMLNNENKALKNRITELEKMNDNLKREISVLESKYTKEIQNLNTEIKKINKTINEKDNKIENYEKDLKNKDKAIKDLENELDSVNNENDKLKRQNKNISIEITKITKIAEEKETTIKNYEKELKNLNNDYDKINEENQKLNKMITENEKIIKDFEKEIRVKDKLISEKDKKITYLEKELKDIYDEKDKFQIEIKNLNSEITELNKQINENNKTIKNLEIGLGNTNDNLSEKEKGIKGLEKELEKEDQLYYQNQKLNKDIKNLNTEITPLTKLIEEKDRNIKSLKEELKESNNQNNNLNNDNRIHFESQKDNHLSLYNESQYSQDIEEDDKNVFAHIFEKKKHSLFGSHYSIINLKDNDKHLKDEFEKLADRYYKELKNIKIDHKFIYNKNMNINIFNYKIKTYEYEEYKICRVNYWAKERQEIGEYININPKILDNIKTTNEIQIYNYLDHNTGFIYFVLNLCFERFSKSITKLKIYQIGLKVIDESLFTFVASYLSKNPKIDTFYLCGRSQGQFHHLKDLLDDPTEDDKNEKLERRIYQMEYILNLYQVLMKKTNLVELRLIIFLDISNFSMLGVILQNNTNLRVLEVRNVIYKFTEPFLNYYISQKFLDEIFVFFNYLFAEENITELALTHFIFSSEINFMAVQAAKTMKNLEILNLTSSYGLVNNDDFIAYNLSFSPITQLNMSMTYFKKIRNWDSLINPLKLKFLDAGICDFPSFTSLCRYLKYCHLEKVIVRLDKHVIIENIPALFDLISGDAMRSKYLKKFYVLNAFDQEVKEDPKYKKIYLPRLFNCMKYSKVMRKLSFAKPYKCYYEIKDDEEKGEGFKTFKFIKKKHYESVIFLLKAMKILFENYKGNSKDEVNNLIKNVIMYRFSNYRKLMVS